MRQTQTEAEGNKSGYIQSEEDKHRQRQKGTSMDIPSFSFHSYELSRPPLRKVSMTTATNNPLQAEALNHLPRKPGRENETNELERHTRQRSNRHRRSGISQATRGRHRTHTEGVVPVRGKAGQLVRRVPDTRRQRTPLGAGVLQRLNLVGQRLGGSGGGGTGTGKC